MNKVLVFFLLGLVGVAVFGCASARTYQVQVNGYTDSTVPVPAPGARLFVIEDQKAQNPLLEKEVKDKIGKLLEKKGYASAPYDQAQFYVLFTYGLGTPQTVAAPSPSWGFGVGFGGYCGPGVGYGVYWPGCGPFSTEIVTLYDRWLRITVIEGKEYRETGRQRPVWVGEARSTGGSSDLRVVLNPMLVAVSEQFGRNTARALPTTVKQNDPRVRDIERVP